MHRSTAISPRTTLGVPLIPPASVSALSNRLRNRLGRVHRGMAPAPVRILESALSLLEHRVLVAICDAGVPDVLDKPMTTDELALATHTDADRLDRLVRYSAARGWLAIDRRGRVRPTKTTRFLRRDHPGGWRHWVDFVAAPHVVDAVAALSLVTAGDGFAEVNGAAFFDWLESHPDDWAVFDECMASGGRMHALMLDAAVNWRSTQSVCDVGGGTGALARALLDRHTDWTASVFDLPQVIERVTSHPRLLAVAGSVFDSIPAGYDVYLLVNVLHDWGDADAARILERVATVGGNNARVLVVENVRRATPVDDVAIRADVLMAALTTGGRERTLEAFHAIAETAGLAPVRTSRLGSGDVAIEYRATTCARPCRSERGRLSP